MGPLLLPVAIVAMAVSDCLDALATVAEARSRTWVAGFLMAGDNTLSLGVGIIGADTLIEHGAGPAVALGIAVWVTTFFATALSCAWADRHLDESPKVG